MQRQLCVIVSRFDPRVKPPGKDEAANMVLYYWWRDPSAEEVLWPISTMNMHWWFKGTQLGLFGGLAAGMAVGIYFDL